MSKETVIKKMLGNALISNLSVTPKEAMMIAAYILRHVTLNQIGVLFPEYTAGTIRRYVNELVAEKYLNTTSNRKPGEIAIYSISRNGINRVMELIGSYMDEEGIRVNNMVPELLSTRNHRIYANDLYVYICNILKKRFSYVPEQPISEEGELLELEDRFNRKIVPDGYYDICVFDSISKMPTSYIIYQEQDMGTQKSEALTNKLTQYNKFVFRNIDEPLYSQEICFTLNAQKPTLKKAVKKESRDIPETALIMIQMILAFRGDSSVSEFMEFFEDFKDSIKKSVGSRRFQVLLRALESFPTECDSVYELLNCDTDDIDDLTPGVNMAYIRRRNFIRDCILNMPEMVSNIKGGLKVIALDNANLANEFCRTHIPLLDNDTTIASFLSVALGAVCESCFFTAESVNDITFPCIANASGYKVILENISEDMSGFIRAVSLYGYGLNMPSNHLTLLLSSSLKDCMYFLKRTKGIEYKLFKVGDDRFFTDGDTEGTQISSTQKLLATCSGYPIFRLPDGNLYVPFLNADDEFVLLQVK